MKEKSVKRRLRKIWMPCLVLCMIFGLCGPIQLYLMNMSELWFSIGDIGGLCLLCSMLLFAILSIIGLLLPERIVDYYVAILFGISVGLYIQGNFIATDYGVLDGREINWDDYRLTSIWNTLLWLACIAIPVALQKIKPKITKQILNFASGIILAMQLVTVGLLLMTNDFGVKSTMGYVSDKGINTASSQENVVVFVLDTFDQEYFDDIRSTDPDFLSPLDGFTYFDNATGMYPTTKGALPYILTGQIYKNEQLYDNYIEEAYQKTDYYQDLISDGYDIGIYTSDVFLPSYAGQYFSNYVSEKTQVSSYSGLAKTIYNFVCFRYFPHILKEKFWFYSGAFDEWKGTSESTGINVFIEDNFAFYDKIKNDGLQIVDDTKCYRFIHLYGVHTPYNMNENVEKITDGSATVIDAARGSLRIVYEYLEQLKKHGIYDDSTIVIMADHGVAGGPPTNPLFMVKPRNRTGGLQVSSAPVCQGDLMGTIAKDIGLNDQNKYGRSAFEIQEGEPRERKYLYYNWDDAWSSEYLPLIVEYQIDPENNDLSSYHVKDYPVSSYILRDTIQFGKDGSAQKYCITGFSNPEESWTWVASKEAKMAFEIGEFSSDMLKVQMNISKILNQSQKVTISIDDVVIYDDTITAARTLEFGIRKEYVQDGILELDFQFPDAMSPYELGISADVRTLAVGFTDMTIEETNLTELELTAMAYGISLYDLGTRIKFNTSENHTDVFTAGISGAEENFTWSLGTEGEIKLAVGEVSAPLEAEISVAGTIDDNQVIYISAQGKTLYEAKLPRGVSKIQFSIPKEAVVDGILTLELSYPNAVSPQIINPDSTDTRVLSVGFSDMVITEQAEKEDQ